MRLLALVAYILGPIDLVLCLEDFRCLVIGLVKADAIAKHP